MPNNTGSIINPDDEQYKLVQPPKQVKINFGVFVIDVPIGKQFRLFKNGAFVKDLTPGRHIERDFMPFVQYSYSEVDTQIHTTKTIVTVGSIPGEPGMPPCRVEIPLKLTYQLQDIDKLLKTADPETRLELITKDQATTEISQLRYSEYAQWATRLRDELARWLQIYAAARTGLQVLEVLIVGEPRGQNEADRLMLKKFTIAREIEIADMQNEADRRKKVKDAQAIAQVAGAVGLDAGEVALGQIDGGREILAAHLRQEEIRINALGVAGAQPLIREYTPEAAQLPAAGGTSGASAGRDGRMTPDFPSDASYPGSATQGPSPAQPAPASPTLDRDRVDMEIAQLEKKGYRVQHAPALVNNAQGGTSHGYKITVSPSDYSDGTWERVQFELGPDFPQVAPIVYRQLTGAAPKPWKGSILENWKNYTRLEEVLEAALREAPNA